jgi:hypothetical protein
VSWGPNQINQVVVDPDDDDQQAVTSSLASYAQEEKVRHLQAQMQAQSKQMQAQAQLALQSRQQVAALEAQLLDNKAGAQQRGVKAAANRGKPQQQPAPAVPAVQHRGTSADALDMILNGSAGGKPAVQPALVIWSDAGKKKIEQALHKLDSVAFAAVQSTTRLDAGTPNARHIVNAFAQDVPLVQQLLISLLAAGMQAEYHDHALPSSVSSWSRVPAGNKPKTVRKGKLAGQAQAGLSSAIAKAGQAGNAKPPKRVHGQCDYFSASLTCPRGPDCRFTCYNGPGKP